MLNTTFTRGWLLRGETAGWIWTDTGRLRVGDSALPAPPNGGWVLRAPAGDGLARAPNRFGRVPVLVPAAGGGVFGGAPTRAGRVGVLPARAAAIMLIFTGLAGEARGAARLWAAATMLMTGLTGDARRAELALSARCVEARPPESCIGCCCCCGRTGTTWSAWENGRGRSLPLPLLRASTCEPAAAATP